MANEFWLSDGQWAVIDPLLPKNRPGAHRVDDRRVISGIVHVLRTGCRWQDCPSCYGPPTTIYNRFHRWSARGLWQKLFRTLVTASPNDVHMIDSTTAKAHRSAACGKGGGRTGDRALARRAHDQNPRCCRQPGPAARHRDNTRTTWRSSPRSAPSFRPASGALVRRRCRLRQRRLSALPAPTRDHSGHPEQSNAKANASIRHPSL
jgi:transposase